MDKDPLNAVRRAFARQLLASVGVSDARLEDAFATVERERYLGPGPWPVVRTFGYIPTSNPVHLYADVLVGLIPERHLNNGMPSYHAVLMAAAGVRPGDHVVHIGAGVGYYTAILAKLAGPTGRVTAVEYHPVLAQRATRNLADLLNVRVIEGDGFAMGFDAADVIYVNAGATGPAEPWLDSLNDGGRMILPLTARRVILTDIRIPLSCHGAVFRITRDGETFRARWISDVGLYPCEGGGRDEESELALEAALRRGGWARVTRLVRAGDLPAERCWLSNPRWSLTYY